MKSYYECNSCHYKSTRKTNANRHIELVHKGKARAFNFKSGKDSAFSDYKHSFERNNLETNDDGNEQLSIIMDNMLGPFEELENLTSIFPENEKNAYLSIILLLSFITKSPVNFIQYVIREYKTSFILKKFADRIAKYHNLPVNTAEELIKNLILSKGNHNKLHEIKKFSNPTVTDHQNIDSLISNASVSYIFNKERSRYYVE